MPRTRRKLRREGYFFFFVVAFFLVVFFAFFLAIRGITSFLLGHNVRVMKKHVNGFLQSGNIFWVPKKIHRRDAEAAEKSRTREFYLRALCVSAVNLYHDRIIERTSS